MDFLTFSKSLHGPMKENPRCRGFSLIEMLIVVAILGLLVSIAVPALNSSKETARITAARGAAVTLNTATQSVRLKAEAPQDYVNPVLQPGVETQNGTNGVSTAVKRDAVDWLLARGYITVSDINDVKMDDLIFNATDHVGLWKAKE